MKDTTQVCQAEPPQPSPTVVVSYYSEMLFDLHVDHLDEVFTIFDRHIRIQQFT